MMRVLAKGVRRIPSRRGGHLEPLTRVLAIVNSARDWWYLAHVETQDYYEELRQNTSALDHAQWVGRLLLDVGAEGEALPDVFDFLAEAWKLFPRLAGEKQVLLELGATAKILDVVGGVSPNLDACRRCGQRKPSDAILLDSEEGGWHCLECHGGLLGAAVSLTPRLLSVLRYASIKPDEAVRIRITPEEAQQLLAAVRAYTMPEEASPRLNSMMYGYAAG